MSFENIEKFIDEHIAELIEIRRGLHKLAEASGEELKTAARVEEWLKETEPDELYTQVGGTGLIAVYKAANTDGNPQKILLRAELDALPVDEPETMSHASVNPETAHKCGHDGHMTLLLGVARYLRDFRFENCTVMLLFQPAEETGAGAIATLETGIMKKLAPDAAIALHNLPGYPKHQVIARKDIFASASAGLRIRLKGAASHAAHPENGQSPVPAFTAILQALQSQASDRYPEHTHALITITGGNIGGKQPVFGITPSIAEIRATLRTAGNETLRQMIYDARKVVESCCEAWNLEHEITIHEEFDAVTNDAELVDLLKDAATKLQLAVYDAPHPFSWSEDIGRFSEVVPVLLFGLGSGKSHPQLHHKRYDFPDELLVSGIRLFLSLLYRFEEKEG